MVCPHGPHGQEVDAGLHEKGGIVDSDRSRMVASALAEWRAQLIDVGATNRLLYYRVLKVGTLDLEDADRVGIEQLRRLQPVRLGRLFSDLDRLASAQRSVRQIAAKARAAAEEFGVPDQLSRGWNGDMGRR